MIERQQHTAATGLRPARDDLEFLHHDTCRRVPAKTARLLNRGVSIGLARALRNRGKRELPRTVANGLAT